MEPVLPHAEGAAGEGPGPVNVLVAGEAAVGGLHFRISYLGGQTEQVLSAAWVASASTGGLALQDLSGQFRDTPFVFDTPDAIGQFGLRLKEIGFNYSFRRGAFVFRLSVETYGSLSITIQPEGGAHAYQFRLELGIDLPFDRLPLLGGAAGGIAIRFFEVGVHPGGGLTLAGALELTLGGAVVPIALSVGQKSTADRLLPAPRAAAGQVKWLDLNKDLGPVHLARAGFDMGERGITVHLDAGVRLSVLLLEALGLYVTIPLKKEERFTYGLEGLAVTLSRPPIALSGGLFLSLEGGMRLYTGSLTVKVKDFQLSALGSYGQFEDGAPSLFVFLLVCATLGGPPAFVLTGIAGGFGYNRSIRLPSDIHQVAQFPFVAAALGTGGLSQGMTPAQVLRAMNQDIRPEAGQYFACAGLRLSTFGMADSFLLACISFGKKLEISLLGQSRLSLPPKAEKPFVYIELLLMAVMAPDDGFFQIQGALTSASYLLDPQCKIRGGFAVMAWFGNHAHSGDFVVTLGGYRDGYHALHPHYPQVDRLSVDWAITSELCLKAQFYFALTPACIMMGGGLSITYELGRLKAWFRANLELFLQWSPLAYEASVSISLGASFRWDFFPFYHTFTIELGASLALWGPPFGGEVHISWFIISFTIHFGQGKPSFAPLDWSTFSQNFLQGSPEERTAAANGGQAFVTVSAVSGVICQPPGGGVPLCSAQYLQLSVSTRLPCTQVYFALGPDEKDYREILAEGCREALGVLPMGLDQYSSTMVLSVTDSRGRFWDMVCTPVQTGIPRAMWNAGAVDRHSGQSLLDNQITGILLHTPGEQKPLQQLPDPEKTSQGYDVEELCKNETLLPIPFRWNDPPPIPPKQYPHDDVLGQIARSLPSSDRRDTLLDQLSGAFGVSSGAQVQLTGWGGELEELLLGVPELRRIGATPVLFDTEREAAPCTPTPPHPPASQSRWTPAF